MTRYLSFFPALFALFAALAARAPERKPAPAPVSDSLYTAMHPRLLLSRAERPALRSKVRDGGRDDEAYAYVHGLVDSLYPASSLSQLMDQTFGMRFLLDTGLVCHLDDPPDDAARELGRALTLAVADSFAADDNTFYSPVRLRILCWGYDMCMDTATPAERGCVRDEINSYVDSMMTAFNYERWLHSPYTSNLTAMIGASLGIAAICLSDEADPARTRAALARADTFVAVWKRTLDPEGSCREGVQYGAWALNHLAPYFYARKRFDGRDYGKDPAIRAMEAWLAFEMLPEPGSVVNNLNDTAYLNHPLTRHGTYIDWAMTEWSSGVAAWMWERIMGTWGYDWGINQDRAATILWWKPIPPVNPGSVLPRAMLWRQRGLYYYRTGWPQGASSDDVVFSFYSGKFHGGHTQQDQNSFTLYGYGSRFAADNGFDAANWTSEAHNMVFIDGVGQHYAGTTYGTDGDLAEHMLGGYADYLMGDATAAYTTHSHFNDPGVPFPGDDWSAGYQHPNPVQYAQRRFIVVHQGATPPYFILLDDIRKDGGVHRYDWRMHTESTHALDMGPATVRLTAPSGAAFAIDVLAPDTGAPAMHEEAYANPSADPDTRVLVLSQDAVDGRFAMVMRLVGPGGTEPARATVNAPWGGVEVLDWPAGPRDVIISNPGLDTATVDTPLSVSTDARMTQVRLSGGAVSRAVIVDGSACRVGGTPVLQTCGPRVTVIVDAKTVHVSSADACFKVYAPAATAVLVDGAPVPFTRSGDYVMRGDGTPRRTPSQFGVNAYPSPFSQNVTIAIDAPGIASGEARVYDVGGRAVRSLWSGNLVGGRTLIAWDGNDDAGRPVASGVYFLRATSAGRSVVRKIVRVR